MSVRIMVLALLSVIVLGGCSASGDTTNVFTRHQQVVPVNDAHTIAERKFRAMDDYDAQIANRQRQEERARNDR